MSVSVTNLSFQRINPFFRRTPDKIIFSFVYSLVGPFSSDADLNSDKNLCLGASVTRRSTFSSSVRTKKSSSSGLVSGTSTLVKSGCEVHFLRQLLSVEQQTSWGPVSIFLPV